MHVEGKCDKVDLSREGVDCLYLSGSMNQSIHQVYFPKKCEESKQSNIMHW